MDNHSPAWHSENRYLQEIYNNFRQIILDRKSVMTTDMSYVASGAYEEQDAFTAYGQASQSRREYNQADALVKGLYREPYFAHIGIFLPTEEMVEDYFLSNNERLEHPIQFGENKWILPFKRDAARPVMSAIFDCYKNKNGKCVKYKGNDGNIYTFNPQIIRDDEIKDARLNSVVPYFPEESESSINSDELLVKRLDENRANPKFRNIISTLQRQQFEIVEVPVEQSFVVQGCAGSGKSQCLVHRLFYLRDELSQNKWEQVLLLTPTQLFRSYASIEMRRFQLDDVLNFSVSDLYYQLLTTYDNRFKNRQYEIQFTEEFLPDEYLRNVYSQSNIEEIRTEIRNAINKYVSIACQALGKEVPVHPTTVEVNDLISELDTEIKLSEGRESELSKNPEYIEERKRYSELEKEIIKLHKSLERIDADTAKIQEEQTALQKSLEAVQDAEHEKDIWISQRKSKVESVLSNLEVIAGEIDKDTTEYVHPAVYAQRLFSFINILSDDKKKENDEYLAFLNEYCEQEKNSLRTLCGGKTPNYVSTKIDKKLAQLESKREMLQTELSNTEAEIQESSAWIRQKVTEFDGKQSAVTVKLDNLKNARYFLGRLESTVFEQEVWNSLLPLKNQTGVKSIRTEEAKGHRKEIKILYKSDLMFYLQIYMELHPDMKLPNYQLICIDEGQDLHKADYDLIRKAFPNAILNVFGDLDQTLHTSCGVQEWTTDTGIEDIYYLNKNYRNTPEIVEFCKKKFSSKMEYIGKVNTTNAPKELCKKNMPVNLIETEEMVIIVKGYPEFLHFCDEIQKPIEKFEFLDTTSSNRSLHKIAVYTIFAAKGLEFKNVLVYSRNMTKNQLVVACTRAMGKLYYYE